MRVLALALVALAATAAQARSAGGACGRAVAKQAIRATHLRMTLLGDRPTRVSPAGADRVICHDFTRDGRLDLAVTIASGGTAGDVGFAVFRSTGSGWEVALARSGYKLGIFRIGDDLVSSQPVYRKHDPNCCPTGGFDHVRFHWNRLRFVVRRSWHTSAFRP